MDINPRRIGILLYDGINLLDVAGPIEALSNASIEGLPAYTIGFWGDFNNYVTSTCGIRLYSEQRKELESDFDDLLVPGGVGVESAFGNSKLIEIIKNWRTNNSDRRVISVCSGALLLAESGILDDKFATTHWRRIPFAKFKWPQVKWRENCIFTGESGVFTSAGITAGIDLALSLIRLDWGGKTARAVARHMVVSMQRPGDQSQFSELLDLSFLSEERLRSLIEAITATPSKNWTLDTMANFSCMSGRNLTRKFNEQLGISPVKFVEKVRVLYAKNAIIEGAAPNNVSYKLGYKNRQQLSRSIKRELGVTITSLQERFVYRSNFKTDVDGGKLNLYGLVQT